MPCTTCTQRNLLDNKSRNPILEDSFKYALWTSTVVIQGRLYFFSRRVSVVTVTSQCLNPFFIYNDPASVWTQNPETLPEIDGEASREQHDDTDTNFKNYPDASTSTSLLSFEGFWIFVCKTRRRCKEQDASFISLKLLYPLESTT